MFPTGTKRRRLGQKGIALVLLLTQLLVPVGYAEPPAPDPFGGTPAPREGGIEPEDDILGDPVDNFGFEPPPENLAPPPLPGDGGFGAEPPPPPPPDFEPTPPGNGRPFIPGARGTPPAALGGNNSRPSSPPPGNGTSSPLRSQLNDPAPRPRNRPTPKLEDYLELDPSVKGLQVQNFDFADKEIKDLVVLISKWTGKNFILDNKVRGRISIVAPSQVTLQEAYQAFLSALDANGLTTVKSGKFIRIIDAAEARRSPVETYAGDYAPNNDQFITRIFQLQYISADEVQREFRDLVTRQGKLFAYAPTNTIIITDTGSNIRRIEDILRTLDVKGFETSLHVLRIRYSSAKQIAEMLDQIYGDDNQSRSRTTRTFRRTTLDRTRGGGIISKVIPDEQTNSLIILANRAGFRSLQALVNKLDVRVTDTGRIHVYYCEYAKAEDLAQTLASLSGGSGTTGSRSSSNRRNTRVTTPQGAQPPSLTAPGGARPSGATGPVTAELGEGIKITADPPTNSLVITASSADYQTLKRVIRKLDIPRLQVFVETAILEVTLDNQKNIQTNLATSANGLLFSGGTISDSNFLQNLFTGGIPEGATIPILGGRRVQVTAGGQTINLRSFAAILNFLTKTTQTSVLSTPQILALDNEKSEFKVQDEIPVQAGIPPTGAAVGAGVAGNVANIERLKTGIEIKLTPHVNAASRSIRLEIEQKVDSLASNANVPAQLANIQRAKTTRETNTNVVVKDGDYIMLGGLMSDKVDEAVSKVPLLGDIPILGWLFKKQTTSVVKTNLVILLHPRIIGTSLQGAELISDKLRRRKDFIDRNAGGNDDHAEEVKDLTRRVESQRRRGRGTLPPAYRNDNDRARPSREDDDENPPVNEDFADPDRPTSRSGDGNRNRESEEVRSDPKARLMPDGGRDEVPADDPLLLPPDSEGGGLPGDIPPPPPPPEGFEPPPPGEVE